MFCILPVIGCKEKQWRQAIGFLQIQHQPVVVNFMDKFAPFYWYAPNLQVVTSNKVTSDMKTFWYMEYLTGLTDPEHKTQKEFESRKWKAVETRNFEGVGLIYKYESRN